MNRWVPSAHLFMSYTLNISLVLQDSVARDLTRIRLSQRSGFTSLTAALDRVSTSVSLASYGAIAVGQQLLIDNELVTVSAAPAGGPLTVTRGDTSILAATGAAVHAVGAPVYTITHSTLASMHAAVIQNSIMTQVSSMGAGSEALTSMVTNTGSTT